MVEKVIFFYFYINYDDDPVIPEYEIIEGNKIYVLERPKLQFIESLRLNFTYKI